MLLEVLFNKKINHKNIISSKTAQYLTLCLKMRLSQYMSGNQRKKNIFISFEIIYQPVATSFLSIL